MPDEPVKVTDDRAEPTASDPAPVSDTPAAADAAPASDDLPASDASPASDAVTVAEAAGSPDAAAGGAVATRLATLWSPSRPRVVIKADLLPSLSVLSLISVLGLPIGWLWARLAPPQLVRMYPGGQVSPLPLESYHSFDDFGIFALASFGVGLLTGFVAWRIRRRRGPVLLIAVVLGSAIAAWLAMHLGVSFAVGRYPVSAVPAGATLRQAPQLTSAWLLIVQPLAAALSYGTSAAWCGMDDLGRRLD